MHQCTEAIERAARTSPAWLRVIWAKALGVYSPDPRWEPNTLKGFVEQFASILARLCGIVIHRSLLYQNLLAINLGDWNVEASGDECILRRRIVLKLLNGLDLDLEIEASVTLDGSLKRLQLSSRSLACKAMHAPTPA